MSPIFASMILALPAWATSPSPLTVTAAPLESLVRDISCRKVQATLLMERGQDPHSFTLTPRARAHLAQSQFLIRVGDTYEHWFRPNLLASSARALVIVPSSTRDPHFWNSPRLTKDAAQRMASYMTEAKILPRQDAESCLSLYFKSIDSTVERIEKLFSPIPQVRRVIATNHDSLGLFGEAFHIRIEPLLGLSSEGAPTPKRLHNVIAQLKSQEIKAIFLENTAPGKAVETAARDAGVAIGGELHADSLPLEKGEVASIPEVWWRNAEVIAAALQRANP